MGAENYCSDKNKTLHAIYEKPLRSPTYRDLLVSNIYIENTKGLFEACRKYIIEGKT